MTEIEDTPEWFYRYFQSFATADTSSSRDWTPGIQAAQLWKQYHDTNRGSPLVLQDIIRILMPNRYAGSGFLGLWQSMLRHLQDLPVDVQIPLWQHIFDMQNHGNAQFLERRMLNRSRYFGTIPGYGASKAVLMQMLSRPLSKRSLHIF